MLLKVAGILAAFFSSIQFAHADFHGGLGLSPSLMTYVQPGMRDRQRQYSLVASGFLDLHPDRGVFFIGVSGNATIGEITHFPKAHPELEFLKYEGHIGFDFGAFKKRPGIYTKWQGGFQNLQVNSSDGTIGGIAGLTIPEGIFSIKNQFAKSPPYWILSLRYSPIVTSKDFSFKKLIVSRDVGAKLQILISNEWEPPPIYIGFEYQSLNIRLKSAPVITIRTFTMGLTLEF